MSFSASDLASVQAAILAFVTGTKAVQVMVGGKQIKYNDTDLSSLQALESRIQSELGLSSGAVRRTYARNGGRASAA